MWYPRVYFQEVCTRDWFCILPRMKKSMELFYIKKISCHVTLLFSTCGSQVGQIRIILWISGSTGLTHFQLCVCVSRCVCVSLCVSRCVCVCAWCRYPHYQVSTSAGSTLFTISKHISSYYTASYISNNITIQLSYLLKCAVGCNNITPYAATYLYTWCISHCRPPVYKVIPIMPSQYQI